MNIIKHYEIFNPDKLQGAVAVIGVGAVGSQVVLQLAKLGVKHISVYDPDVVESHNIANQLYATAYIGELKVMALEDMLYGIFEDGSERHELPFQMDTYHRAVRERQDIAEETTAFVCVDSMKDRAQIVESLKYSTVNAVYESRMNSYSGAVYSYCPQDFTEVAVYKECLYPDEEVLSEKQACGTIPSIISTATLTASLLIDTFIKRTMGRKFPNEVIFDLKHLSLSSREFKRSV